MLKSVDEDYIVSVIKNHEQLIQQIHTEFLEIFREGNDEMIEAASFPKNLGDHVSAKTNALSDLQQVYEKYLILNREWEISKKAHVRVLVEQQETINRIMACYHSLPVETKHVLDVLYVKSGTIKEGMDELIKNSNTSKTTVLRQRKEAVELIKGLYNSNLTNLELYKCDLKNKKNKYR